MTASAKKHTPGTRNPEPGTRRRGFTLIELLVATSLLTIAMIGVYVAFSNTSRIWKLGEKNLAIHQDARMSLERMRQDLMNMPEAGFRVINGGQDSLAFLTVGASMAPESTAQRVLYVTYRLEAGENDEQVLIREERRPSAPLPLYSEEPTGDLPLGEPLVRVLARNAVSLRMQYLYLPLATDENGKVFVDVTQEPIVSEQTQPDMGVPFSVGITLNMANERAKGEIFLFETLIHLPEYPPPQPPAEEPEQGGAP